VYWSAKRRTRVFSRFCAHAVTRELSCGGTADLEQFTSSEITGMRIRKVADLRIGKIPNANHLFTPILLQGTLFHPTIRSLGILENASLPMVRVSKKRIRNAASSCIGYVLLIN
jgi:hypothetical protein